MTNNHTEDFYIEVIRARSLVSTLTLSEMIDKIVNGTFEYKAFGISKEVAIEVARKAFKANTVVPLGGGPLGYQIEGNFISEVIQSGLTDVAQTVTFGAGGVSNTGFVSVAANGEIEIIKPGYYFIKQRFRVGRVGASGISNIFFWAETSSDGGNTWNFIGNSVDIALDSSGDVSVFFDTALVAAPEGTLFRNRFARSGDGDDSGDLRPSTPSASLVTAGVPTAPSAQVSIYTLI